MKRGPLVVLSGPSGSGKSTVVDRLLVASDLPLRRAVTATSRAPRPGELPEVSYHFWTPEQFQMNITTGAMLEWAFVHGRDYYGTPKSEVEPYRDQGRGVILIIDVQGAATLRRLYPDDHLSVFLRTSTFDAYEARLQARGEKPEAIAQRLRSAQIELACEHEFAQTVLNDDLTGAVAALEGLIRTAYQTGGA